MKRHENWNQSQIYLFISKLLQIIPDFTSQTWSVCVQCLAQHSNSQLEQIYCASWAGIHIRSWWLLLWIVCIVIVVKWAKGSAGFMISKGTANVSLSLFLPLCLTNRPLQSPRVSSCKTRPTLGPRSLMCKVKRLICDRADRVTCVGWCLFSVKIGPNDNHLSQAVWPQFIMGYIRYWMAGVSLSECIGWCLLWTRLLLLLLLLLTGRHDISIPCLLLGDAQHLAGRLGERVRGRRTRWGRETDIPSSFAQGQVLWDNSHEGHAYMTGL